MHLSPFATTLGQTPGPNLKIREDSAYWQISLHMGIEYGWHKLIRLLKTDL
jgi:hypothetical protein